MDRKRSRLVCDGASPEWNQLSLNAIVPGPGQGGELVRAASASMLVLVLGLVYLEVASVQGQTSFGPSDRADIEQLFESYGKAFANEDYAKLREHIQAPFVRFGPSNTFSENSSADWAVLRTMDDAIDFFRVARNALKAQGVDVRADGDRRE
jgi:hypothetical protein